MKLVFLGGGGHAKILISEIIHFIANSDTKIELLGYTDFEDKGEILGLKYLGKDKIISPDCKILNCIGSTGKTSGRYEAFLKYKSKMIGFISPQAIIHSHSFLKEGISQFNVQVMPGSIINHNASIGENSLINTGAIIEHDVRIGASTHIAPGAVICGGVSIGSNVHIGAGSTIIQNISICDNAIIGAGSVVVGDINQAGTYIGNPATKLIKR